MYILLKDKSGKPVLLTRAEIEKYGQRIDEGIDKGGDSIIVTGENLTRPLYLHPEEFSLGKLRYQTFGTEKLLDVNQMVKWDAFVRRIKSKSDIFAFFLFFIIFASAFYFGSGIKLSQVIQNMETLNVIGMTILNPAAGSKLAVALVTLFAVFLFVFWFFRKRAKKAAETGPESRKKTEAKPKPRKK